MPVLVYKIDIYYEVMPVLAYNLNTGGTQKFVPEGVDELYNRSYVCTSLYNWCYDVACTGLQVIVELGLKSVI